jgi:AGCS family alanine or glycine:cation symporter
MQKTSCRILLAGIISLASSSKSFAGEAIAQGFFENFFGTINSYWGSVLFYSDHPLQLPLILLVMLMGGFFFTFRYGFVNIRLFKHSLDVIRGKYDREEDAGEINHFQALTSATEIILLGLKQQTPEQEYLMAP